MKRHIPNLLTLLNVFCGSVAVVFAILSRFELAALWMFAGIFLDFFDGLAARVLKVKSDLGLQLDSLADMITSGLVPGVIMFRLLGMSVTEGWNMDLSNPDLNALPLSDLSLNLLPFAGFLITLASAYRLAKFNIDTNQTDSFIGLPTPANALLIVSLPLLLLYQGSDYLNTIILNQWFLLGVTLISSYLLNSKLPLFALKFKTWNFKDNAMRYIFLIVSLFMLLTLRFLAIPAIILFYIVSSLLLRFSGGQEVKTEG